MDSIPNNDEPVDDEIFFAAQAIQQSRLGFFISAHYSQLDHLFSLRFFPSFDRLPYKNPVAAVFLTGQAFS
jgi:hypothetical protein